jgi:transposase, IS30 family
VRHRFFSYFYRLIPKVSSIVAYSIQKAYEALLVEAREGIPLSKESFYEMDAVVSGAIRRGQHLYHIMQTNDLGVSKSTIYRHLNRGYLSLLLPVIFPAW